MGIEGEAVGALEDGTDPAKLVAPPMAATVAAAMRT
jgi:hypothetical protein